MDIIKREIFYKSRKDVFTIVPIGDIHIGNIGCDIDKLKEDIEEIRNNRNYFWIGIGDFMECINLSDKRFDPKSIDPDYSITDLDKLVQNQTDDVISLFYPIREKCLAIISGNHEETIRLQYYQDVCERMAYALKVPFLGYSGFIKLIFYRFSGDKYKKRNPQQPHNAHTTSHFTFYITHGYGGSRKAGAKINKMEDLAHMVDCNIVLVAHEHKKIIGDPIQKLGVSTDAKRLVAQKTHSAMCGSYLRGYVEKTTTYIEKKCYPPSDLGTIRIYIKPSDNEIHMLD